MALSNIYAAAGQAIRDSFRLQKGRWVVSTLLLTTILLFPVLFIAACLFVPGSEIWSHIRSTLLPGYIINSLILIAGVTVFSGCTGIFTAWIVSRYRFIGVAFFRWALLLPLAVPGYIAAYSYAGLLDYSGPLYTWLRNSFGYTAGQHVLFNIMSLPGAIFILSATLYPYIYAVCRIFFNRQSAAMLESAASLGSAPWRTFFKVGLPMARPAIVGGLALVWMEVLNDYGTVHYFGVDTLTIGVFNAWFGFGEPLAAMKLAALMLWFVFLMLGLERLMRGRKRFHSTTATPRTLTPYTLTGSKGLLAVTCCVIPLLLGFVVPVAQLGGWAFIQGGLGWQAGVGSWAANSIALAGGAALLIVGSGLLLAYTVRLIPNIVIRLLSRLATLGYVIPGAVIAVGVLVPLGWMDHALNRLLSPWNMDTGLLLSGTVIALLYGYAVRFLAVGYFPVEAALKQVSRELHESARSLGRSAWKTLWHVEMPLIKTGLLGASLLVSVDVLKELPMTLILRPFNFDTLATKAFELAGDERLVESSGAALIIILAGVVAVYVLDRLVLKD